MKSILQLLFLLCLTIGPFMAIGQKSREQLEEEKKANQARIERAERVLNQTSRQKKASLGKLKAINSQINSQVRQIDLISQDISLIEKEVGNLEEEKKALQSQLDLLKREYAEMLYIASKSSGKINKLSFLFSARSFNDLIMRYKYLEQYTDNRKKQVAKINAVAESLALRQQELNDKIGSQQKVIDRKQSETKKLSHLKQQQAKTVSELASEEKKLRKEIANSKRAIKRLDNLISSLVSKSVAKTSSASVNEAIVNTKLSASFQNNKRKLPWPVQNGFISDRFGVKNHPVLKNLKIDNNGVDIQTSPNARVSSVFDGIVLDISQIPGLNNVIAVQHGEYFTVYANLKSVNVKINQEVIAGQLIGIAGEKDGEYEINFQVWHQFTKENPENWLARK